MEGGVGNFLDPEALEYYPSSQFGPAPAQIYYPYPPPPLPPAAPCPPWQCTLPEDGEPTREIVLSLLPRHLDKASVIAAMEDFGDVRAVETAALASHGTATVHFYDLRSAVAAVFEIREQHMRQQSRLGRQYGVVPSNWGLVEWPSASDHGYGGVRGVVAGHAVWAQFGSRDLHSANRGALFVFNCDPAVPSAYLAEVFGTAGDVKEVNEVPWKPNQRVLEYFDLRDAVRAQADFNGKEVCGRSLVVEFRRPVGHGRSFQQSRSGGQQRGFVPPPRLKRWPEGSSTKMTGTKGKAVQQSSYGGIKISTSSVAGGSASVCQEDRKGKAATEGATQASLCAPSSPSAAAAKQQPSSKRAWKIHSRKDAEARFQFKEVVVKENSSSSSCSTSRDTRTTVMIKNIPNKYSQKLLLRMLDDHCIRCNEEIGEGVGDDEEDQEPLSAYDFVYLPIDFSNKCNVGYGFVNMTSPEAAVRLYKEYHMQPWEVFNSRKICQVTYARLQGLEALKEHFKNSKFACDTDEYMPVVFVPPRDGKQLTVPVPVGGRGGAGLLPRRGTHMRRGREYTEAGPADAGGASSTTTSTHAPSDHADGADDDRDDDDGRSCGCDETLASDLSQALRHHLSYTSSQD
ncbi:hypothetical protein HPP92_012350 [Vanilla planifolia]|uniref:RRM domain-containing protein n=1 Tax=Vanilla planifolia TaxID=51239 RepID=A0A835QUZ7_VANPL|nr:hypothetical protein HPP92_012350 [Vanilla planifolia]